MRLKSKIYKRMFLLYFFIITASIIIVTFVSVRKIDNTVIGQKLYLSSKNTGDVSALLKGQEDESKTFLQKLYANDLWQQDLLYYVKNSEEKYLKHKLDTLYESNSSSYYGMENYFSSLFQSDKELISISLYSYENDTLHFVDKNNLINKHNKIIKSNSIEKLNYTIENSVNEYVYKTQSRRRGFINIFLDLKDTTNLKNVGKIVFTYSLDGVDRIIDKDTESIANIFVINSEGIVLFDSKEKYETEKYPDWKEIENSNFTLEKKDNKYFNYQTNQNGMSILGVVDTRDIKQFNIKLVIGIYILALVLIILVNFIVYYKFKKLERRTNNILNSIEEVENGNLESRIAIGSENDEIALISKRFNFMCERLDRYIKQVYVAEIKQKNAEIMAFQNQINPHFLYNTLESIRMKAVTNGDKQVGKMLYNLATLFRNMVKQDTYITMRLELEHCKMYLELYKFKYENKFDYIIECDEELTSIEVIKFSIQPIIENFLIHGINHDSEDNLLMISVTANDDNVVNVIVEDNGLGMSKEQLKKINKIINEGDQSHKSIGLTNVNERIKLAYGIEFGLSLDESPMGGAKVIIKIPRRIKNNV
ncbi:two-component system, sensor histidine kinase YesM [Clostridium cavendishii DSM 21758]|uniref:Two-component system, sensor histidine kinase YesM n=1 Tax=Clostridium cavendishii DSM 21758 TaxID=1121302 RepID=A0A1M6MVM9_9CLOT|nr:histidine kinase [Clostridium cavendishii]SHJ87343.1 two-component system, sensor histidine kinase YesM [Clostridium cavendishii DSM 21758]